MGAWGYCIRHDDFVLDVIGVFEELLKAGHSVRDATKAVKSRFASAIKDSDDGPLFWLALADVQWTTVNSNQGLKSQVTLILVEARCVEEDTWPLRRRPASSPARSRSPTAVKKCPGLSFSPVSAR
jgi:hypothetical protein